MRWKVVSFVGGAVVQWLRDGIGLIPNASITEQMAKSVSDNGGVYFVPALTGFGCAVLGSIRTWRYYRDYPRNYGGSFNPVRLWRASAIKYMMY